MDLFFSLWSRKLIESHVPINNKSSPIHTYSKLSPKDLHAVSAGRTVKIHSNSKQQSKIGQQRRNPLRKITANRYITTTTAVLLSSSLIRSSLSVPNGSSANFVPAKSELGILDERSTRTTTVAVFPYRFCFSTTNESMFLTNKNIF